MRVPFEGLHITRSKVSHTAEKASTHLHAFPVLFPIPKLDCHVIASCQDKRLRRVDGNASTIGAYQDSGYAAIRVCLPT